MNKVTKHLLITLAAILAIVVMLLLASKSKGQNAYSDSSSRAREVRLSHLVRYDTGWVKPIKKKVGSRSKRKH